MKYNLLDIISCPMCKHFPLKLYGVKLKDNQRSPQKYYNCEQYCGYFQEAIANARPSNSDCAQCLSKSIEQGILFCEQCGSLYQIKNGIPKLIQDELKSEQEIQFLEKIRPHLGVGVRQNIAADRITDSFVLKGKRSEMGARGKVEKDKIMATLTSKSHQFLKTVESKAVSQCLNIKGDDILLDAGAGHGIFSIPLSRRCRYVVSTDITFEALLSFREFVYGISTEYFKGYEEFPEAKIHLIQADSCHLPFRKGFYFNKAISTQVVSHIPGEKQRESSIKEVWNYLEHDGIFVLTVGNDNLILRLARLIKRTPRERILLNSGVGYYYKFRRNEFRELLESAFVIEELFGLQNPIAYMFVDINNRIATTL